MVLLLLLYEVLDGFGTIGHFQHTHQKPSILGIACCSHFFAVTKLVIIGFLHVAESSANTTTRDDVSIVLPLSF